MIDFGTCRRKTGRYPQISEEQMFLKQKLRPCSHSWYKCTLHKTINEGGCGWHRNAVLEMFEMVKTISR